MQFHSYLQGFIYKVLPYPRVYIAWKIHVCKLRVEYPRVLHAWNTRVMHIPRYRETWSTPTFVVGPHVSTCVNVKL